MFFVLSKIFWFLLKPGNVLLILLVLGVALLWTRWRRLGRWLVSAAAVTGLFLAVVPVGSWMFSALEERFPPLNELPVRVDGIVVAGGVVDPVMTKDRGQASINSAVERLFEMAKLAERYPRAKMVYSGGAGNLFHQDLKEAPLVVALLRQLGVDPGRVIFEDQSRNTAENAVFSRRLAKPKEGETWILVTSAFHMPRAVGSFRRAGWRVTPYPVDYHTLGEEDFPFRFNFAGGVGSLNNALHEYLGLLSYWLNGKTDELFPGPKE